MGPQEMGFCCSGRFIMYSRAPLLCMANDVKPERVRRGWGMGGGATWYQPCPDVCVKKCRIWVPFQLQENEMNEKMSFKMGVKFAAPLYMGRIFSDVLYKIRGENKPN